MNASGSRATGSLARLMAPCMPFFFSSRRRHTRCLSDWSSDVCSSDLEEGHLLQTPGDGFEVVGGGFEDAGVCPEPDGRPGFLGGSALLEGAGHRLVIELKPLMSVPADVRLKAARQCIDDRHPDAVQSAGHRVGTLFKLAAGM